VSASAAGIPATNNSKKATILEFIKQSPVKILSQHYPQKPPATEIGQPVPAQAPGC
jgi:hypothetical protein